MLVCFISLLLARLLPKGRGYARGGGWVRFKYSEDAENNDPITAVRLDNP